jgi:competence protein ComEC
MILGEVATLTAMVVQPVGQVIAWATWVFLEFTIVVVQATASLPLAAIEVGRFDVLILALYYALLLGVTRLDWRALRERVSLRPALALGIVLVIGMWVWNLTLTAPDGKTHVVFLDGGTTFVQTPRGVRVLIDGGADPSAVLSALGERMPFWDRSVDLLVLTDADDDHLAGLVAALERYDVKQIVQVNAPAKPTAAYIKWRDLTTQKRIASLPAQAGLRIQSDREVVFEILYPADDARPAVARLRAGNLAFLFADSASAEDQSALLASDVDIASAVLIAPRKISAELLDAVNPQYALVFAGSSTRGKPSGELLTALSRATVLQTDERGTVEMIVDAQTLTVKASGK